jgi:hypothetical protein
MRLCMFWGGIYAFLGEYVPHCKQVTPLAMKQATSYQRGTRGTQAVDTPALPTFIL